MPYFSKKNVPYNDTDQLAVPKDDGLCWRVKCRLRIVHFMALQNVLCLRRD